MRIKFQKAFRSTGLCFKEEKKKGLLGLQTKPKPLLGGTRWVCTQCVEHKVSAIQMGI